MIDVQLFLDMTDEQRVMLGDFSADELGLMMSLGTPTFKAMFAMAQTNGTDIVKGLLQVALQAAKAPETAAAQAIEQLSNPECEVVEQFIFTLQLVAAIKADKDALAKANGSEHSVLGGWPTMLSAFDKVVWQHLDQDIKATLISEVSSWMHLTVPERNTDQMQHLTLIDTYVQAAPRNSMVRGILQLIKTTQHGLYLLGSTAHHHQPNEQVDAFKRDWFELKSVFEGWVSADIEAVLERGRIMRLCGMAQYLMNDAMDERELLVYFSENAQDALHPVM